MTDHEKNDTLDSLGVPRFSSPAGRKEAVRQAIIKAVPSVMDLKMGCYVSFFAQKDWKDREEWAKYEKITEIVVSNDEQGIGILTPDNGIIYPNIKKMKGFEIIGRPISLQDVLVAIGKKWSWGSYSTHWMNAIQIWDLSQDFDHQSEAAWEFLYRLLCE